MVDGRKMSILATGVVAAKSIEKSDRLHIKFQYDGLEDLHCFKYSIHPHCSLGSAVHINLVCTLYT